MPPGCSVPGLTLGPRSSLTDASVSACVCGSRILSPPFSHRPSHFQLGDAPQLLARGPVLPLAAGMTLALLCSALVRLLHPVSDPRLRF